MVKGGWNRVDTNDDTADDEKDHRFIYSNADLERILKATSLRDFISSQYLRYIVHICRLPNTSLHVFLFISITSISIFTLGIGQKLSIY